MSSVDPYQTRVPDGQYRVAFARRERGKAFQSERWFCWFRITEPGAYCGLPLLRFYNMPRRPWLPRTHNLTLDYVALFGRRPPPGLTPEDFLKGVEVLAEVVTVKSASVKKRSKEQPEDLWYSKIARLLRITAGSPSCGRAR